MVKRTLIIISVLICLINCLQIRCFAFDVPTFYVTDSSCYAGDEIEVEVKIENNPGIISCLLLVNYDSQYMTLIDAQSGDYEDVSFGPIENNPFSLTWSDGLHDNNTNDGCLVRLKFKISESTPIDSYPISLSYDPDNVFNFDEDNVYFDTADGIITVKNRELDEGNTNNPNNVVIEESTQSESTDDEISDDVHGNNNNDVVASVTSTTDNEEKSIKNDKADTVDGSKNRTSTDTSNSATCSSLTAAFVSISILGLVLIAIKKK
ncbi:cohesin domain-containing protein [Ruminococcus sp.]|uniref:cohesin domain-containing protein n=1 Tax=Ruminococcus sp. TaxID=41978 RepID=UPI001B235698|nr:cohesin domain-containing protein [Ruminococcus sp.]MBO5558201.1 hypothetical protein [Ruminococcus sp.]